MRSRARPKLRGRVSAAVLVFCAGSCGAASAEDLTYTPRDTYGELGILDMPSARMAPDGQIAATIGLLDTSQRYNIAFQILPWLEGSFRYSRVGHIFNTPALYDRSFGLKLRLSREDEIWPEISLGIRDLLGTGVYGAEYLVATKRISDFDVSAGLGWGRLASVDTFPNPFGLISDSFKTRSSPLATGGTVNFGQFFHGPAMGLFGGVIWHSPIDNLDLLAEYSSDAYVNEVNGGFKVRMPVNVGLAYRLYDIASISAGWYYGSTYGVTASFSVDPTIPLSPQRFGPDIPAPVIRPVEQQMAALSQLIMRNRPQQVALPAHAWVQLPRPAQDADALVIESALMAETTGVHAVDVMGRTLVVDAHFSQRVASRQCDRYAGIVAGLAPHLETIALSDLDDPSGRIAFCKIAHTGVQVAENDTQPTATDAAPPPTDPAATARKIREDVTAQSLEVEALSVEPAMVWLYFTNTHYNTDTEAVGRVARVLMADAPPGVEVFHIITVRNGVELRDFEIARSALERATLASGSSRELGDAVSTSLSPLSNPVLEQAQDGTYPRFHWSFGPGLREGFFDPDQPIQIQVLGSVNASVDITPKLTLETRLEGNIYNNYDTSRNSNSLLPHVRSDLNLYFRDGINGIANLDALYRTRLTRDVYFEAKAGYLEDMFAGGGAQILWRPEGERVAFSLDAYEVWQRDFNRLFGLQDYHVLTGHASMYYESPWYGLNFAVHAGRYLAGDYGATIEVTRRFETGVEIGAFATFTNVPFSKFGEGSFDKGILVHIPLEWALPFFSQSTYDLRLRSLIRDGGQRLDDDDSLYQETRPQSYGVVLEHIDDIVAP
ncbi:MAG: YjbH domain-containing protein [Rhizomicrobium sp.]